MKRKTTKQRALAAWNKWLKKTDEQRHKARFTALIQLGCDLDDDHFDLDFEYLEANRSLVRAQEYLGLIINLRREERGE